MHVSIGAGPGRGHLLLWISVLLLMLLLSVSSSRRLLPLSVQALRPAARDCDPGLRPVTVTCDVQPANICDPRPETLCKF